MLVAIVNQTAQTLQILALRRALSKTSMASSLEDENDIWREMVTRNDIPLHNDLAVKEMCSARSDSAFPGRTLKCDINFT